MSDDNIDIKTDIVDYGCNKAEYNDISYLARQIREREAFSKEDIDVIFLFLHNLFIL